MHQRRGVTYDVIDKLQLLSLSECIPALCHRLIYEKAICHSINRETWEKTPYKDETLTAILGGEVIQIDHKLLVAISNKIKNIK